jgi:hypothetical protein
MVEAEVGDLVHTSAESTRRGVAASSDCSENVGESIFGADVFGVD